MKTAVILAVLISVTCAVYIDTKDIAKYFPNVKLERKDVLKTVADYGCEKDDCFPYTDVCPFQFLCQLHCKDQKLEGACKNGACSCFELSG
ncbi:hypothetical protein MTP99_002677 [Tenebrio molitor]|jgi:hypothetical protein|nr:hypothetical protein MTP99_002677 [Tenebrio molitor]CAH1378913.1 unnamed protein product [Tenebrio molitor]